MKKRKTPAFTKSKKSTYKKIIQNISINPKSNILPVPIPAKLAKFQFSKKLLVSACVTLIMLYCAIVFHYSKADNIYAEFRMNDTVSLSFGTSQYFADSVDQRISPLCGCFIIRPHRGVQFFSNDIDVNIADTAWNEPGSLNEFNFFSPFDEVGFNPSLEYSIRFLVVKKTGNINRRQISFNTVLLPADKKYVTFDTIINNVQDISLIKKTSHLSIIPSETFSTAAIIPIKNSKIVINRHRQPVNSENYAFTITENYDNSGAKLGEWETPTIDIFGPEIKVFSEAGLLKINHESYLQHSLDDTNSNLLLIFNIMPQLRLVHTKLPHKFLANLSEPNRPIIHYDTKGLMTIESAILSNIEFQELKKRYADLPIVNKDEAVIGYPGSVINWRTPKITPWNGIYIYSADIASIASNETSGGITYGVENYNLFPSKNVTFKNLTKFRPYDEPIILPFADSSNRVTKFHAVGDLWFNGNERVSFSSLKNSLLSYISIISSLITISLLCWELLKGIHQRKVMRQI